MWMGFYTLVIVGSAYLGAWLSARTLWRLARNRVVPPALAQLAGSLAALAFLTVISMPAGIIIAGLMVTFGGFAPAMGRPIGTMVLSIFAVAIAIATAGVWDSPGAWPASVPLAGFLLLAALIFAANLASARRAELSLPMLVGVAVAAALPLILSPVLFPAAHGSLALDEAITLAALLGILVILPAATVSVALVRLPLSILLGYGAIQAMHYGAWPLGIVSALIWLAGLKLAPRHGAVAAFS